MNFHLWLGTDATFVFGIWHLFLCNLSVKVKTSFFVNHAFTFTRVCLGFFCLSLRWSFKLCLKARTGEWLERIHCMKGLESALIQCHQVIERFEGSEETLRLIRRVEESLRRLMAEVD